MILDEILQNKRVEVEEAKRTYPFELLTSQLEKTQVPKNFFEAIKPDEKVKIIAEVKCASPSKGILREHFNPIEIARSYKEGGAAALDTRTITELLSLTCSLGMNAIVEVHDEEELERALLAESKIIGINNRDLKKFTVSLDVSIRLSRLIPDGKIVVSESGLTSSEEIKRLKNEGIRVFLIGETFMKATDPGEELRAMLAECN